MPRGQAIASSPGRSGTVLSPLISKTNGGSSRELPDARWAGATRLLPWLQGVRATSMPTTTRQQRRAISAQIIRVAPFAPRGIVRGPSWVCVRPRHGRDCGGIRGELRPLPQGQAIGDDPNVPSADVPCDTCSGITANPDSSPLERPWQPQGPGASGSGSRNRRWTRWSTLTCALRKTTPS